MTLKIRKVDISDLEHAPDKASGACSKRGICSMLQKEYLEHAPNRASGACSRYAYSL
jgi:hypothetical protein